MNPFDYFLQGLADKAAYHVSESIKQGVSPLAPYLRRLGLGSLLIITSAIGWAFCLVFLLLAFFFELSPLIDFVDPALWTSLFGFLFGFILIMVGLGLVRQPRS